MNQQFGGTWTAKKLDCVEKYLQQYVKVMKNQNFRTYYIDAFAGTGYIELRPDDVNERGLLKDYDETELESRHFLQGSADRALEVSPPFDRYIFIEQSEWRTKKLRSVQARHYQMMGSIDVVHGDGNAELCRLCAEWRQADRGVVFLDPFGMGVEWTTLQAIARTQALDLWYLFPISATNRLLVRDGDIPESWQRRLTSLFGTNEWRSAFFAHKQEVTLFGTAESVVKTCNWQSIQAFLIQRLKNWFPGVAENPLLLRNSNGTPLFLLCFAVSNPSMRAKAAAMRIASHILRAT